MMYTFYWCVDTRATTVHMALEEAGLPYKMHIVDIKKGEHNAPDYLAINPKGFVPTLVTPNGDTLTETGSMLMHISEQPEAQSFCPSLNDPIRSQYLDWFFFHMTVLHDPYKRYYYPHRYVSDPSQTQLVIDAAAANLVDHWTYIDQHLQENGPYHLGDRFSLLDMLMGTFCAWQCWGANFFAKFPAVEKCYSLVKSRPALTAIIQEHESST